MARIPMGKRMVITVANVLFPPLAVMLITGLNTDVLINCVLFLLVVFPSHIHGLYISLTYFNRKRKVRKGIYPGDKRSGIYSEKVQNGGATRREVAKLKAERDFGKLEKKESRQSRPGIPRQLSNRIDDWDDGLKEVMSRETSLNRQNDCPIVWRTKSQDGLQPEKVDDGNEMMMTAMVTRLRCLMAYLYNPFAGGDELLLTASLEYIHPGR
ncbi:uncharacterized protein AB675_3816 [Cyphellophora attinorum]|uniref:Plasma membrane proteolipid 3 n=1 Tax=Cyphellophora attinorum TaxID=1664694 RepID=A0A0N1GXI4_9EURO|nr:uncharacterized protein AB675_3816 [Phialophora attinorum]KPI34955.1 hypothetical protein AB675_3816 [Phialophora attinorum]